MRRYVFLLAILVLCLTAGAVSAQGWRDVQGVFGGAGVVMDNVLMIELPRTDQSITVSGIPVRPQTGFVTMLNFQRIGRNAVMTAELCLLESELARVQSQLRASGIALAEAHNHAIRETPRFIFMHASGQGEPVRLARVMRTALGFTGTPLSPPPPPPSSANWSRVQQILGVRGRPTASDVAEFTIPRREGFALQGRRLNQAMGAASILPIQMIGGNRVVVNGEVACTPREVNGVIDALMAAGIAVPAIHHHFIDDSPRLIFVHCWGIGTQDTIAAGLRNALSRTNSRGTFRYSAIPRQ